MRVANGIGAKFLCAFWAIFLCRTVRRHLVTSGANSQNHPEPNFSGKVIGPEYEKPTLPTGANCS